MPVLVTATLALVLQSAADPAPLPRKEQILLPLLRQFDRASCGTSDEGEIVVCGKRDNEQYRLRSLPPLPEHRNMLGKPIDVKIGPVRIHGLSATIGF